MLQGDRLMLRRALSNILSNALRYTPKGESIRIHLQQRSSSLEIKICNPGSTIPAHHLSRIFERFYRADHARQHADGEGSGLGLAIVKAIIDGHRGQIKASSDNEVTCFTIELPQAN